MKGTLTFNLPEERDEFETAVNADNYRLALFEISQKVFRPARKHGYPVGLIQELLDKADSCTVPVMDGGNCKLYDAPAGTELVSQLEKLFYQILQEVGVEI